MRQLAVRSVICLTLVATACTSIGTSGHSTTPTAIASPALTRAERWTADITYLVEQMEDIHPDLFHGVSSSVFHEAADELIAAAPQLDDDQLLVGIMQLGAMISAHGGDGHMGVWPPENTDTVHRFPIRLWEFPDGLYVTAARAPNERLVGSRIVAVDGVPIDAVLEQVDSVVPRDTASNLRDARTVFLTSAEVLTGLGIAKDSATMLLDIETPSGERRSATVDAIDARTYSDWVGGWELLLPERPDLLFLRDASASFRVTYLDPERTVYVRYNVVQEHSAGVVNVIRSTMREHPVDRIVLDLRNNGGGESGGYRELVRFLAASSLPLDVLIGRLTFSAATSLVLRLERRNTGAVLIGETMGGAATFWAHLVGVTLPYSGLFALISERYFRSPVPHDDRTQVPPDIAVAFTASDYFSGHDPVLLRALA